MINEDKCPECESTSVEFIVYECQYECMSCGAYFSGEKMREESDKRKIQPEVHKSS